jgi:hypothetical protein
MPRLGRAAYFGGQHELGDDTPFKDWEIHAMCSNANVVSVVYYVGLREYSLRRLISCLANRSLFHKIAMVALPMSHDRNLRDRYCLPPHPATQYKLLRASILELCFLALPYYPSFCRRTSACLGGNHGAN